MGDNRRARLRCSSVHCSIAPPLSLYLKCTVLVTPATITVIDLLLFPYLTLLLFCDWLLQWTPLPYGL